MAEILSINTLHQGWDRFSLVRFRLDDGSEVERAVEDHGDAVVVLPYDPVRRVALLVKQFRGPVRLRAEAAFLEPPAGILEEGEALTDCARLEAFEETGVRLDELEPLGACWASPGSTTERSHLFLAAYGEADRTGSGGGVDEHEDVEVCEVPLAELAARLVTAGIEDLKLLALLLSLMRLRPELFA